ncbi:hypothetical protein AB3X52_11940 [Nocardioides sp. DS6]|uniref:Secreted protein n=1 Tax=Nocardioides eburneus TaxID=3231482 RepID=A0ABV3SZF7_9ACTN
MSKPSMIRRAAAVAAGTTVAVASSAVLAGPAGAAVPDGWAPEYHMNAVHLLAFILFIPVGIALVISLLVLLPGVLRGEGLLPKAPTGEQPPAPRH